MAAVEDTRQKQGLGVRKPTLEASSSPHLLGGDLGQLISWSLGVALIKCGC